MGRVWARKLFTVTFLLGVSLLSISQVPKAEVLVTFDGDTITDKDFLYFAREVEKLEHLSSVPKDERMAMLEHMLVIRRLADLGRKKGLESDPEVR